MFNYAISWSSGFYSWNRQKSIRISGLHFICVVCFKSTRIRILTVQMLSSRRTTIFILWNQKPIEPFATQINYWYTNACFFARNDAWTITWYNKFSLIQRSFLFFLSLWTNTHLGVWIQMAWEILQPIKIAQSIS